MVIADLLFKLRTVERSIHPGTDAKVSLLPAACIMSECSLMSEADLLGHVNQRAKLFVEFFMHNNYGSTTLEEALRVYAEFHIEGQQVVMVCTPDLVVPPQYLGLGLHSRGKRGRPRRGDQGEDEGEESVGCRGRVQQTKGYTVPKTSAQLETVDSEDDAQPAPRAPTKVLTCCAPHAVQ